jgi:ribosomal protein L44E
MVLSYIKEMVFMPIQARMYEDKKELLTELVEQRVNKEKISELTGIPYGSIAHYMRRWGVSRPEAEFNPGKKSKYDHLKGEVKMLCLKGIHTYDIADEVGIPRGSIAYILKSWGLNKLPAKSRGGHFSEDGRKKLSDGVRSMHRRGRDHHLKGLVALRGRLVPPEEQLAAIKECVEKDMTYNEMGAELGLSEVTFWKVMKDHGILQGPRKAERSQNWIGGHKKYRGPGWQKRRKECLRRDGYKCVDCGKTNAEELKDLKRQLSAHHLVPYETSKDSSLENLITVCQSCHMKREHKEGTFSTIY